MAEVGSVCASDWVNDLGESMAEVGFVSASVAESIFSL